MLTLVVPFIEASFWRTFLVAQVLLAVLIGIDVCCCIRATDNRTKVITNVGVNFRFSFFHVIQRFPLLTREKFCPLSESCFIIVHCGLLDLIFTLARRRRGRCLKGEIYGMVEEMDI